MQTCEDLQTRSTADIEWSIKPNHLLFNNIPEVETVDTVEAFRRFLASKLNFRDEQIELLQIKKLYRTPFRNRQTGARPLLVKFLSDFERDWVYDRAFCYLQDDDISVSVPKEVNVKLKRTRMSDPLKEESGDDFIHEGAIQLLQGAPTQRGNMTFKGYFARIQSHHSVKYVLKQVMQKHREADSVQHVPYAFRLSQPVRTQWSVVNTLLSSLTMGRMQVKVFLPKCLYPRYDINYDISMPSLCP